MNIITEKLNFTVGPVMMAQEIKEAGAREVPYFRTTEFSQLMKENETYMKKLAMAKEDSRVVFLTGSGTAAMEMAVMNSFTKDDKVLVVNGGGFGQRFEELCEIHEIPFESILLSPGESLEVDVLNQYNNQGFTGLLVNMHETSTGVLYDMKGISDFCKRNQIFLVVDAISAFLADELRMGEWGINVLITSSQKAFALPPGMSFLILDAEAVERMEQMKVQSMYFNVKDYLKNGERGQTPFTPAVGVLIQLNIRLQKLVEVGLEKDLARTKELAQYFRSKLDGLPFEMFTTSPSNAVTAITPTNGVSAYHYFERLEKEYNIWVCPNGGALSDKVFRVGHIGALEKKDYDRLIEALTEIAKEES